MMMTFTQDFESSITINGPSLESFHPDDQSPSSYITPGFKPFSSMQSTHHKVPNLTEGTSRTLNSWFSLT